MKRMILAALAASLLAGGAASAAPFHPTGGHGPVAHGPVAGGPAFRGGAAFRGGPGPVVVRGGPVFRGGAEFRGGPVRFGGGGFEAAAYRHFGYGEFWPRAWLSPEYFIADFAAYDLGAPPANYEWVQNGPDALLVNLYTGMVVQVVPGAFA